MENGNRKENKDGRKSKSKSNSIATNLPTELISPRVIANDSEVLVQDYVIFAIASVQTDIIYPPFGHANFLVRS